MPRVVDHEERRREIAGAVWRTVARRGIEAATVREIADEAGFSTGVLAHYFEDKDDLIVYALRVSVERAAGRMRRRGGDSGLETLRAVLGEGLPLDEERRGEMRVWINFWGRATGNEALGREQARWYAVWRSAVRSLVEECQRSGEIDPGLDPARAATTLVALVDGIGIQATFEPDRLPPEEQEGLLDEHLRRLAAG